MEARLTDRLERMDVRLDRIESEVKQTHSELFTLRAGFKEFSRSHKEPA
jgi:chaperonin cofactor prefoldin